jgi:hypothetical protein
VAVGGVDGDLVGREVNGVNETGKNVGGVIGVNAGKHAMALARVSRTDAATVTVDSMESPNAIEKPKTWH